MSTLVYMKLLEQTPVKYDRGMRILTLGRIDHLKQEIAERWIEPGEQILEIGCGTGSLAVLMTQRGAQVTGIDISETMLSQARQTAPDANFLHMTVTELKNFEESAFDAVVSTLAFSELSTDERKLALKGIRHILKPNGKFILVDEVRPTGWLKSIFNLAVRWPLVVLTFALTQNTTHALSGLDAWLERNNFHVVQSKRVLLGTLALVVAEKS
jgi:ubiquinone/menaquinone biosynthesis C-methylase UbiE